MKRATILWFGLALITAACGGEDRVVVAAGTTIVDGGLLDAVVAAYEDETGAEVSVVGAATRQVLELGAQGAADLLITHAPAQEAEFLASHPEAAGRTVFASDFLLVGPAERTTALAGLSPAVTFERIAAAEWTFVTRDDGSGTWDKEQELWQVAGVTPGGDWYLSTGQGMGFSLQVADQRDAFILAERGAFMAAGSVGLVPVEWADSGGQAANPYTAIAVAPGPATELLDWLGSSAGADALVAANEALYGDLVYVPL